MIEDILNYATISLLPVSAIIASIYHKKTKNTALQYLVYLLWFLVVSEIVAYILGVEFRVNIWWYNIATNIEKVFFLWLFYQYIYSKRIKRLIIIGGIAYELFFIVFYFFFSKSWNYAQSFADSFGGILLIIVAFSFLIEMLLWDKIRYIKSYLIFWVAIAYLFYLVIAMPYNVATYYIQREGYAGVNLIGVQRFANLIMYSLISLGYIWSNKVYK